MANPKNQITTLRLILGDQLNRRHSWFRSREADVTYVLIEARSETDYAPHHLQKVAAIFAAMRDMYQWLISSGHQAIYIALDHPENKGSIAEQLLYLAEMYDSKIIEYQYPDEYRLDQELSTLRIRFKGTVNVVDSEHFLTAREDLQHFFAGKKTYLMESFYRYMRKRYKVLMDRNEQPLGAQWNFDHENRNHWDEKVRVPALPNVSNDVSKIIQLIDKEKVKTIGFVEGGKISWPLNPEQAELLLQHFLQHLLPHFGSYQDAMHTVDAFLFHSRLSFALNTKILHPLDVIRRVEAAWEKRPEVISLAQAEGFIRQIIGWREYMRGVYWSQMPAYKDLNYFGHERKLPEWFWTGNTKMNCLQHTIKTSLNSAYAHHIQRLMITGNFALLAGIHPDDVDQWYLGIYIDALEWVEITNTRGMSQFADGGIVGTKPYVSSANYIDKMSNYCKGCTYDKKEKIGGKACPFNSLYWHFYDRHREKLQKNPRIGMMYRTWDKMHPEQKVAILKQAEHHLVQLESL